MNANVELCTSVSKTGKEYYYLSIKVKGKEIGRLFIKETEIPYYMELLK